MTAFDPRSGTAWSQSWAPYRTFPHPDPTPASHLPSQHPPLRDISDRPHVPQNPTAYQAPYPLPSAVPYYNSSIFDHGQEGYRPPHPPHRHRTRHHHHRRRERYPFPFSEDPLNPRSQSDFSSYPDPPWSQDASGCGMRTTAETMPILSLYHDHRSGYAETVVDEEDNESQVERERGDDIEPARNGPIRPVPANGTGGVASQVHGKPSPWNVPNGPETTHTAENVDESRATDSAQASDTRFEPRRRSLSTLHADLTAREAAVEEAENRLRQESESLSLRERHVRQLENELDLGQGRIEEARRRWKPPYHHTNSSWRPHARMDGTHYVRAWEETPSSFYWGGWPGSVIPESWPPLREDAGLPRSANTEAIRRAFDEYNTHWEALQHPPLASSSARVRIRFPTLSGEPFDLLAHTSRYVNHVRAYGYPPNFFFQSPDELVHFNVYGFFLDAFSIPLSYTRPWVHQVQQGSCGDSKPYLDFRGASMEDMKSMRDHLLKKELNRWHPDKLGRYLAEEGKEVVSADGSVRLTERTLGACVDRAIRELKTECDEALKRTPRFAR